MTHQATKTLYTRRAGGALIHVRLMPDEADAIRATQADPRGLVKGLQASRSLILRRAFALYTAHLLTLTPEQWASEAAAREELSR